MDATKKIIVYINFYMHEWIVPQLMWLPGLGLFAFVLALAFAFVAGAPGALGALWGSFW